MDGLIKIWACKGNDINTFSCLVTLDGHEDIVRDVSWRTSRNCIVSGGDDHLVNLWIGENEAWEKTELGRFDAPVMRVTWDEKGGFLVLATSDGLVYLFKESGEGLLELISQTNNEGVVQNLEDQKK